MTFFFQPNSVKDALGHVLAFGNVNQYSPVLPDDLQAETSNVGEWIEFCGEGGIDDCRTFIPYYEAADKFRQVRDDYFQINYRDWLNGLVLTYVAFSHVKNMHAKTK